MPSKSNSKEVGQLEIAQPYCKTLATVEYVEIQLWAVQKKGAANPNLAMAVNRPHHDYLAICCLGYPASRSIRINRTMTRAVKIRQVKKPFSSTHAGPTEVWAKASSSAL